MTDQKMTRHPNDHKRLFYVCLILSLALHIIASLGFYFYQPKLTSNLSSQPTMVKLVELPQPRRSTPAPEDDKQKGYEVDPLPKSNHIAPEVESFRKADRDQQVLQEQAPTGQDARDETVGAPALPALPAPVAPPAPQRPAVQKQQVTKQPIREKTAAKQTTALPETAKQAQIEAVEKQESPEQKKSDEESQLQNTEPQQPQMLSPEQLFPDARTLSRIAQGKIGEQNRIKQRDDVEIGDTVWLNLQNNLLVSFFRRFHDRIERVWNYPKEAAQKGTEGTLELLIIVNRDGELIDVLPTQSSGSDILDLAAIQAVYAGAPFGPLSEHYPHQQLKIRALFSYRISGRYIYGR